MPMAGESRGYCLSERRATTLKVPVKPSVMRMAWAQMASKSPLSISTAGHTLCTPKTFVTRRMHASISSKPLTKIRPSCSQTSPWSGATACLTRLTSARMKTGRFSPLRNISP